MRALHGTAGEVVSATPEDCLALLAAIDGYPDWYPGGVREVEVLKRNAAGQATRALTVLHVDVAGFNRDFHLTMAVKVGRGRVALNKIKADDEDPPFDVVWQVSEEDEGALISLDLDTALPLPRLMPLGGVGNSIARSFVSAASEELDASA